MLRSKLNIRFKLIAFNIDDVRLDDKIASAETLLHQLKTLDPADEAAFSAFIKAIRWAGFPYTKLTIKKMIADGRLKELLEKMNTEEVKEWGSLFDGIMVSAMDLHSLSYKELADPANIKRIAEAIGPAKRLEFLLAALSLWKRLETKLPDQSNWIIQKNLLSLIKEYLTPENTEHGIDLVIAMMKSKSSDDKWAGMTVLRDIPVAKDHPRLPLIVKLLSDAIINSTSIHNSEAEGRAIFSLAEAMSESQKFAIREALKRCEEKTDRRNK